MNDELERLYSPSQWSSRGDPQSVIQSFYQFSVSKTKEVNRELEVQRDVRYGSKQSTLLDIYRNKCLDQGDKRLFVFVHGGFWQEGSKDCYGFFKEFCLRGLRVMVPGYTLAPQENLGGIMKEMKELLDFLSNYTSKNNIKEVWLCGHSAGAQLALSMLHNLPSATDVSFISGFILISGIYQLEPVIQTSNNDKLQLSREDVRSWSPMNWLLDKSYLDRVKNLTFLIAVGEDESPAFIQQSTDFAKLMESKGIGMKFTTLAGCDHFNIITDLYNKDFALTNAILDLILHPNN